MKGKYIVIEGAEGVGKTTMVQLVARQLEAAGLPVRIMREPDSQNDLTARAIRHLTQDPRYPMNTRTEVLLYNAARSQSLQVIREATATGIHCLVDRSYLTTLGVQYYGRGDIKDYQKINEIIAFAVGDMWPDLTIVLDAPVDILRARTRTRYRGERFDNLDSGFLERVRAGYLWEARQRLLPVVSASGDTDSVFSDVWELIQKTLAEREPSSKPFSVAEVLAGQAATPVTKTGAGASETQRQSQTTQQKDTAKTNRPTALVAQMAAAPAIRLDTPAASPLDTDDRHHWLHKLPGGAPAITTAGRAVLEPLITDTTGSVYAFTEKLSPVTVAAAMARLSRRGDDMRITLLDEFIGKTDKDSQLLQRVITAYGDDSVQQLVGQHIVVENASNLLTKKLEWGRLAAYLEQSTRYIFFDQKDARGHYRYYVPDTLSPEIRADYVGYLDTIFDTYSRLVAALTEHVRAVSTTPKAEQDAAWRAAAKAQACDAVRSLLPVATTSTVGIYASGQALESLVMHLLSDDLPEARTAGEHILREARKVIPVALERADKPDRGGAIVAYRSQTRAAVSQLAAQLLPESHTAGTDSRPVTLTAYTPHNELDVVADILYEYSDTSLVGLKQAMAKLSYQQKVGVLQTYMGERLNRRHKPGRALETVHYSWDLVCDYGIFRDLQRHRMVDDLQWQPLSPRLGFDVPHLVEEAGLSDQFEHCFDISLKLYSILQAAGYELEAQYVTLLGHKMRWKVTMNAREAFHFMELRTSPQGHPGYRKLAQQMYAKLCEVHPLIGSAMRFVNQGEDPELTRLAAERYTQFKLNKLNT